jgi:hypothetical protein
MKPADALTYLADLIQEDTDSGLMPALRALGLWEPIAAVIPRAKAVAAIEPVSWLDESSWTLRVGHEMEWAHVAESARDTEVKRILDAFERACAAYGDARHLEVRVSVTNESLPDDCGYDVIDHVRGNPDFEVLTDYTPLDSSLELDEDEDTGESESDSTPNQTGAP